MSTAERAIIDEFEEDFKDDALHSENAAFSDAIVLGLTLSKMKEVIRDTIH